MSEKVGETSKIESPGLLIGAYGWRHPQWAGSFYPDDMPEDWWLPYYSNEFSVVLVPECDIHNAVGISSDMIESWGDDVNDGFLFFIELNDIQNCQKVVSLLEPIWPFIGGFVLNCQVAESGQFIDAVNVLNKVAPVCIGKQAADLIEKSINHGDLSVRPGQFGYSQETDVEAMAGDMALVLCEKLTDSGPKKIRELVDNCLVNMKGVPFQALFVGGGASSADIAKQAITIKDFIE